MALKQREKMLVGLMMIAGGIGLLVGVALPKFDEFNNFNSQVASLNDEIKNLNVEKTSLDARIALLEKNTAPPPLGVEIRTFTPDNKDEIIKGMLDVVVNMATGAGNKFISLLPLAADASAGLPAPTPATTTNAPAGTTNTPAAGTTNAPPTGTTATGTTDPNAPPPPPPPPLFEPFQYELSVRGTYDTLQAFLRSLQDQKELMEISSVSLVNEANGSPQGGGSTGNLANPAYPLKLTAKVTILLQPQH